MIVGLDMTRLHLGPFGSLNLSTEAGFRTHFLLSTRNCPKCYDGFSFLKL